MMKSESGDIDQDWTHGDLDHSTNRPFDVLPFKYPIPDSVQYWRDVVKDYSRLHLTFSKDRLPALAAIVQRMLRMRKTDTYIAGLWKSSLLSDLTWRRSVRNSISRGCPNPEKDSRLASHVPSWSWASITDAVDYGSDT
jgi:hypothetical protein